MSIAKTKEKPKPRRTQILGEAIRMLGDHGFNGLTVQALAERCGISNAGLLYYFRSKDELLLAVLDEFELGEREALAPLIAAIADSRDDDRRAWQEIVGLLETMVARFAQSPDLARLLFVLQAEALDRTHIAHDWFGQRERLTFDLFTSLLERFVPQPESSARHLIAAMHGLGQHWLRDEMAFDLRAEWRKLSALVLAPLAAV